MALLTYSSSSSSLLFHSIGNKIFRDRNFFCPNFFNPRYYSSLLLISKRNRIQLKKSISKRNRIQLNKSTVTCQLCTTETLTLDTSSLDVSIAVSDDELWATACLRIRSFSNFDQKSYGIDDHKKYLAERQCEAMKERIAGKREGFSRVCCINATLPLSEVSIVSDDLCSACKFSEKGEERVVVGTLDLNQCLRLPDEITGKRPEGIGADSSRAYLSDVCVARELHRNGVAYLLVAKAKKVALEWGITDLYVHVAVDNEPARKLYIKSGFVYEDDEPAWQARFLNRPRRNLLWADLSVTDNL